MKEEKPSDLFIAELKREGREPTREELKLLGQMILDEKKWAIKQKLSKIKKIFVRKKIERM